MDRVIKFRAWNKQENKFWYFTLQEILERRMSYRGSWDEKVLQGEKTQFTDLTDRNGKEIYEGDIVKTRNYNGYVNEVVKFEFGCFHAGFHTGSSTAKTPKLLNSKVEVLGNIYEHPHLLEGVKADET